MSGLDRQAHRAFSTTVELDPHNGLAEAALGLVEKTGDYVQLRCTIPGLSSYGPIALICSQNGSGYVRHGSGRGGRSVARKFENMMNSSRSSMETVELEILNQKPRSGGFYRWSIHSS